MDPTTEAIFSLLKTSLWGDARFPLPDLDGTDWTAVFAELRYHAIQNLAVDQLAKADPSHKGQYLKSAMTGFSHWYRLMGVQQDVCRLLKKAGIPCAVLKGAAASSAYPNPAHRSMGDVDLIVKPEDFDRAYALLIQDAEFIGENYRHKELRKNGIIIELHRAFSTFSDPQKRTLLDGWIFEGIDAAHPVSLEGYAFPMLPMQPHGLVLLEHINVHMESGLGLRQIIDWMMFADRNLSDEIWTATFAPRVQQLGLENLALTVTRMCQLYLGLRNDLTFCHSADDPLCRELMAHILKQGNFGRKQPKSHNKIVGILSTAKNIPALFRVLQRYGCINWPAVQKYPFLKPFAWIHQICRYIRKSFQLKHPVRQLCYSLKRAHSQDILFDRLGVTRIKESR